MTRLLCALAVGCALLCAPRSPALAAPPTHDLPDTRLRYTNLTAFRLNPLGLQNHVELDLQRRLFDEDSVLLGGNYLGATASLLLTPGLMRLGAAVKFRPLAVLKLEARIEYLSYFGNFDLLPTFDSPHADFSDSAIDARGDAGLNYATDGWLATFDAELRAKVGPILLRNRVKASYVDVAVRGGATVFFEPYIDLLLPHEGWLVLNDADVLAFIGDHLIVGARYSFGAAFYPDAAYRAGEARDADNANHRVGPLIAYTFEHDPGAAFDRPTILLLAQWYVAHRWRTGQDVSQAIPYLVLGFAFRGQLL